MLKINTGYKTATDVSSIYCPDNPDRFLRESVDLFFLPRCTIFVKGKNVHFVILGNKQIVLWNNLKRLHLCLVHNEFCVFYFATVS